MSKYITEGPLHPVKHKDLLVTRDELAKILNHIETRDSYIALGNPRQTGKTSILNQVKFILSGQDYAVASIDFEKYSKYKSVDFYRNLSQEIVQSLHIPSISFDCNKIINQIKFSNFLKDIAGQVNSSRKLVVILDEIGGVPTAESQSFFPSLRAFFSKGRSTDPEYELYNKVLIIFSGSLDLYKLSSGENSPLYNICTPMSLNDFSLGQVGLLVERLQAPAIYADKLTKAVFSWTGGHPYLTQKLLDHIETRNFHEKVNAKNFNKLIEKLIDEEFIFGHDNNILHLMNMVTHNIEYRKSIFMTLKSERQKPGGLGDELIKVGILKRNPHSLVYCSRNKIYHKALEHFMDETDGER